MRYLYGDSEPFPLQYDFLAALESFVSNCSRAAVLDAEIHSLHSAMQKAKETREENLDELEAFHRTTMANIEKTVPTAAAQPTADYVKQLTDVSLGLVTNARRIAETQTQSDDVEFKAQRAKRRAEIRSLLGAFLSSLHLPTDEVRISMKHVDGRNEVSAILGSPGQIVTSFTLAASQVPALQHPRKVGDFVKGISLPVGVKRGWFQRSVQAELAVLDEIIVGAFELTNSSADIYLRKKALEKDTLVLKIQRQEGETTAQIHFPEDAEAEGLGTAIEESARGQIESLWQALRTACEEVLAWKERLVSVQFAGTDVVETDNLQPFLRAIVGVIGPVVAEITRRSPNSAELSLKAEVEKGRREEIYIRKADLASKLEPLPNEQKQLFAGLGLFDSHAVEIELSED